MKISVYAYYCSNSILQMLANLSKDNSLVEISAEYSKMFKEDKKVDVKWMLVSTALLMSESIFKDTQVYNNISEKTIEEIEDKLVMYERKFAGEKVDTPYLLDRTNNSALPFSDFLSYPDMVLDKYDYLDNAPSVDKEFEKYIKKEIEYHKEREGSHLLDGPYGSNDSIIVNGLIDIKKLIIRVRNALAHSNYEIINENNIRLFHYNRKENKLDFNVILDTNLIVNILDELNELAYEKYYNFISLYYSDKFYNNDLIMNDNASRDDFVNYIMGFGLCDKDTAETIYDKAIESQLYKTLSNDNIDIEYDKEKYYDNYNKMSVIGEFICGYVKPYCDFGIIINNIMYADSEGKINSDELYVKYDIYDYLKSDFYDSAYSSSSDELYKDNMIYLLMLAFMNASFLTSHNEYENSNIEYVKYDFSDMKISDDIMNLFIQKHIGNNNKIIIKLNDKLLKIDKDINKKKDVLMNKKNILENKYVDNNYFNVILPDEITNLASEILVLDNEKKDILNKLDIISNNMMEYNYEDDFSDFVFKSIRNSLAHGYVKINKDGYDICNYEIVFEDYNPDNKTELTFKGIIRFGDLLKILTIKDSINKLYNIDFNYKNARRI